jgi:predicted  nucleic acid-binding Zn-ribbon protein
VGLARCYNYILRGAGERASNDARRYGKGFANSQQPAFSQETIMTALRDNLSALLALQQIDKQIQRAKRAQAALNNGDAAQATASSARGLFEARTTGHHKAIGELKDCELKLAALETKIKQYQQKLYQGSVTNAKELSNIEKEIASLNRQRSDLDGRILELMDDVDVKRREAECAASESKAAEIAHECAVTQFQTQYAKLDEELKLAMRSRSEAQLDVKDAALLKRYEEIRARSGGIGIAQIVSQNCGGCNMTLPSIQIKLVREAEIEPQACENCGRLLAP